LLFNVPCSNRSNVPILFDRITGYAMAGPRLLFRVTYVVDVQAFEV
jgi:hypothetical protein